MISTIHFALKNRKQSNRLRILGGGWCTLGFGQRTVKKFSPSNKAQDAVKSREFMPCIEALNKTATSSKQARSNITSELAESSVV